MNTADEQLAADVLRDLLTASFSIPAVSGFLMWGFWDGSHWKKNAPLFHKDWSPKPALAVWENLVLHSSCRTHGSWKTDQKGHLSFHAFTGTHRLSIDWQGKTLYREFRLNASGAMLTIHL